MPDRTIPEPMPDPPRPEDEGVPVTITARQLWDFQYVERQWSFAVGILQDAFQHGAPLEDVCMLGEDVIAAGIPKLIEAYAALKGKLMAFDSIVEETRNEMMKSAERSGRPDQVKILNDLPDSDIRAMTEFKDVLALRREGSIGAASFNKNVQPMRLEVGISILATDAEFHQAIADLRRAMNAIRSMRGLDRISDD